MNRSFFLLGALACLVASDPVLAQSYPPASVERAPGVYMPANASSLVYPDPVDGRARVVRPGDPLPVNPGAGFSASGVTPVTASLTSATSTSAFTPLAGRPFNVSLSGTFAATCGLQKSFNSGSTWLDLTYVDGSALTWSAPVLTDFTEGEASVQWRVSCSSFTSGTVVVRISQ